MKLCCCFAIAAVSLTACMTPRVPANPGLARWAKEYGYLPYTQHGRKVYCHAPVGFSGTFCPPSETLSRFMAKSEAPPVPKYLAGLEPPPG